MIDESASMPSGNLSRLLIDGLSIILIDILLAGDNALVIAMAVRGLPAHQRKVAKIGRASCRERVCVPV